MAFRSSPALGLKRFDRLDSVIGNRVDPDLNSVEPEIESFMRIYNYESTMRQLDTYYGVVKRQILAFQSSGSGMWAYNSNDKVIGDVRTSIYCSITVWGLYQAYRRIDDDRGRSYELSQSAVKCMRGILQCWLSQATRIEKFKQQQASDSALHSKFHLESGHEIISEKNYGHLQIDVVSLYLMVLTQMINSGLQIIYTMDEVAFVQNLVYYVERAYRTPDYGIWERGSKYNNGTPEIHASSIGMAKSALEAVNGLNLFGDKGAAWSVVYVDIDAHNRNRAIFETLLPRESSSKNSDASLIPTILFPAFATHDESSSKLTKSKCIRKLKGRYGFKRFLRDGYGSVLEDKSRRYYVEGETKNFENIESEWPIFFAYLVIDGIFKNDAAQVKEYQKLLKHTIYRDKHGDHVIPEYYYVPSEAIRAEKECPGTQKRLPVPERSSNNLFLWGQSIYILSQLLNDGLLHVNELDPIRRYLPSYNRPRRGGRYSAFQGTASDLVVQVVLIVESMRLQAMMATYGIQTQTPHEVEPVQIWPPSELVKVYRYLGVSKKLGLDGRPARPIGALGTSKIYRIWGQTVLCFPLVFEVSDFYLSHDMSLLIDDIRTELQFVGKNWKVSGRPTVCLLIREDHMRDSKFREMLDLLAQLKSGHCNGLKVRTGRLQNLIASSCLEHLDFLNMVDPSQIEINAFEQVQHASIGYQSLTDIPKAIIFNEKRMDFTEFRLKPTHEIVDALRNLDNLIGQSQLLGFLLEREGPNFEIDKATVKERLTLVDRQAGALRYWTVVRYCSTLLQKMVHSVSPSVTSILVNGKQLTIGVPAKDEIILDKPLTPGEFHVVLYKRIAPHDTFLPPLQQEILLYAGKLISTNPELFAGILKFRVGWVLRAMEFYQRFFVPGAEPLEAVSPSEIRRLLYKVLTVWEWARELNVEPYVIRKLEGSMGRVPSDFFQRVWHILGKASGGIYLCGRHMPSEPTLSEMTMSEHGFALRVEDIIKDIDSPEYRHIVIEMILVMSTVLERNPELKFQEGVDIDVLVKNAVRLFWKDKSQESGIQKPDDPISLFYHESFPRVTGYLARAVVNHILSGNLAALEADATTNELSVCRIS